MVKQNRTGTEKEMVAIEQGPATGQTVVFIFEVFPHMFCCFLYTYTMAASVIFVLVTGDYYSKLNVYIVGT